MHEVSLITYSPTAHFKFLKKWLADKDLMHGWGMPPFKPEEIKSWTTDPTRIILMIQNKQDGKIVDFVNFYEWDKENEKASRGTLIDPKYQNQGFGKVAIEKSNKYAFDLMHLKRIELYVEADNERSKHITEKLGYTFDRFDPIKNRYYYFMER